MASLITIGIPTFDRLGYLKEAVASALGQSYPNIEVVVSHDGPPGDTETWVNRCIANDSRLRYVRTPRRLGLSGNLNYIADHACGEWLMLIGDDDRLLPDGVERLAAKVTDGISVVFGNLNLIDAQGRLSHGSTAEHVGRYGRDRLPAGVLADAEAVAWGNAIPLSSALLRVSEVRRHRFNEALNTPELEFYLRLARAGAGFVFTPEYVVEYRTHAGSETAAGLWLERLAEYLISMEVRPEIAPLKRSFLGKILPAAVARCLMADDMNRATDLMQSGYYPNAARRSGREWFQVLCSRLPRRSGARLYRAAWRVHREIARIGIGR